MTDVYMEEGSKRVFACAVEWPGWCRAGKTEDAALEALAASAPRYGVIAKQAGMPFDVKTAAKFTVKERLPGSMTTDFGAPSSIAEGDRKALSGKEAARQAALMDASWKVFDRVIKKSPATLRKGPRGGGRDRDDIARHVIEAEDMYARKIGLRIPDDAKRRTAMLEAVRSGPGEIPEKGWPMRYAVRRVAWHVIDHAWEIEDRSQ
jgi:hypothetical protein